METRKINVNAENMEAESFTGETAVETEKETTEKTVTAGIGYRAASADSEALRSSWFLTCLSNRYKL